MFFIGLKVTCAESYFLNGTWRFSVTYAHTYLHVHINTSSYISLEYEGYELSQGNLFFERAIGQEKNMEIYKWNWAV
jgi:hypothetical protein